MFLPKKLLLRALGGALVASSVVVGCSVGDGPMLDFDPPLDASTSDAGPNVVPDADAVPQPDSSPPAPPVCGNRKVDPGEECDDGNTASGDGCSASCKLESGGPGDVCSDALEVALTHEDGSTLYTASVSGNTTPLFNHYSATCGGGSGADVVYKITSPTIGRAVVKIAAAFPAVVSARTGCADQKTELACKDTTLSSSNATEITFPIFAGAPVFVMVDGYGGTKGDFLLDVQVQTAFCGNGQAEYPETCDDGNTTDGDGCSATCMLEDDATPSVCPGMGYRIATTASFAGDTSTLSNGGGTATACGPSGTTTNTGGGPNALYAITPTVTGALKLDLLANYPNALLHVRRECDGGNSSQVDCAAAVDPLTPLSRTIPVYAEETIFALVDSNSSSNAGLFTLNATLTPAACGNGIVDGGEECDDGNTTDDDGCSAVCKDEVAPESYTCDGKPVRLEGATPDAPGPRTLKFRGSTNVVTLPEAGVLPTNKWNTTATCGSSSPDVVYQLTSDIDGWLTATVKGTYNATLSVRASCDATATTAPLACIREVTGTAPKTLQVAIDKETPYYIVVDAYSAGTTGPFEVDLEIVPSVCGNGVVEGGETCDDGATDDGDGCSATCQMEAEKARDECSTAPAVAFTAAGDGTYSSTIVSGTTNLKHNTTGITGTHTLAPCSSNGPDAWFTVSPPISGVLTATIPEATFRSSIGIRNGCTGTGISQLACDATVSNGGQQIIVPVNAGTSYRVIVDGQNVTGTVQRGRFTLDLHLAPSGCGDTFVAGAEECDDGNTVDGDGCSSTCTIETLPNLAACPGHTVSLTGAGNAIRRGVATVTTTGLGSNTASTCGGSGPEGIVRVVSDVSGILEARATANFNVLLHGRNQCADPSSEIARSCSSPGVFTTAVQKDVPLYLFVDGINGAEGGAKVQFTVTP